MLEPALVFDELIVFSGWVNVVVVGCGSCEREF